MYSIWIRQCGEWSQVFESHNTALISEYAAFNISYSGLKRDKTARVEIRHHGGKEVCETIFDSNWESD